MTAGGFGMQSYVGVVIGDQIREIVFPRILWLAEWIAYYGCVAGIVLFGQMLAYEQKKQVVGELGEPIVHLQFMFHWSKTHSSISSKLFLSISLWNQFLGNGIIVHLLCWSKVTLPFALPDSSNQMITGVTEFVSFIIFWSHLMLVYR